MNKKTLNLIFLLLILTTLLLNCCKDNKITNPGDNQTNWDDIEVSIYFCAS